MNWHMLQIRTNFSHTGFSFSLDIDWSWNIFFEHNFRTILIEQVIDLTEKWVLRAWNLLRDRYSRPKLLMAGQQNTRQLLAGADFSENCFQALIHCHLKFAVLLEFKQAPFSGTGHYFRSVALHRIQSRTCWFVNLPIIHWFLCENKKSDECCFWWADRTCPSNFPDFPPQDKSCLTRETSIYSDSRA